MNISNFTQETSSLCIPNSQLFEYVEVTSFVVFSGLGVFGNVFIIILAAKYTERKNLHYLIINMAVSDILIAIMYFVTITKTSLPRNTPDALADIFCKIVPFLKNTSELLTLSTLLIISLKRYRATKVFTNALRCSNLKLLCVAWLMSMTVTCFRLKFYHSSKSPLGGPISCSTNCGSDVCEGLYLLKTFFLVFLYISVLTLSLSTSVRLSKSNLIQANLSDEQRKRRRERIISAVRMVLCSLLLYSICYLPDFIEDIIKSADPTIIDKLSVECQDLLGFLLHITKMINSFLSPLVYLVFLADFRRASMKILSKHVPTTESTQQENIEDTRL